MPWHLIIPSFIAGILTFLAPCTLPLVPGYLSFISGASLEDLKNPEKSRAVRKKIFFNGLLYVVGFSAVFILLGSLFGFLGASLTPYRIWFSRIGGAVVIIFGLYILNVFKIPALRFLSSEKHLTFGRALKPGNHISSFIFGATFAFGWSPCVGPILGSILLLASTSATVFQGAALLTIFSVGLAVPFLLIAAGISRAIQILPKLKAITKFISIIGGTFLIALGILLVTDKLAIWVAFFYRFFKFINYGALLDYL